jgi:hypothetical protein
VKVKAVIDCVGVGYDLKTGDVAELPTELAKVLIDFNHVEEIKTVRKPKETRVTK